MIFSGYPRLPWNFVTQFSLRTWLLPKNNPCPVSFFIVGEGVAVCYDCMPRMTDSEKMKNNPIDFFARLSFPWNSVTQFLTSTWLLCFFNPYRISFFYTDTGMAGCLVHSGSVVRVAQKLTNEMVTLISKGLFFHVAPNFAATFLLQFFMQFLTLILLSHDQ